MNKKTALSLVLCIAWNITNYAMQSVSFSNFINNTSIASHQLAHEIGTFLSSHLNSSEYKDNRNVLKFTTNIIDKVKEADIANVSQQIANDLDRSVFPISIDNVCAPAGDPIEAFIFLKTFAEDLDFKQKVQAIARHFTSEQLNDISEFTDRALQELDKNIEETKKQITASEKLIRVTDNKVTTNDYPSVYAKGERSKELNQQLVYLYKAKDLVYVMRGYIWRAQHPYLAHIALLSKTQKSGLAIIGALATYCGYQWFSSSKSIDENYEKSTFEKN